MSNLLIETAPTIVFDVVVSSWANTTSIFEMVVFACACLRASLRIGNRLGSGCRSRASYCFVAKTNVCIHERETFSLRVIFMYIRRLIVKSKNNVIEEAGFSV